MFILQIGRNTVGEKRQDGGQIVPGDGVNQRGVIARASASVDQPIIVARFLCLTKVERRARRFNAEQTRELGRALFREWLRRAFFAVPVWRGVRNGRTISCAERR